MKRKTSSWATIATLVALSGTIAACDLDSGLGETFTIDTQPSYWQKIDDFAGVEMHFLDAKLWLDQPRGQYIQLQFQCFRRSGAMYTNEQYVLIESKVDPEREGGFERNLDGVLFKPEGQPAQALSGHTTYNGYTNRTRMPLSNFKEAQADFEDVFRPYDGEYPSNIRFRFVYNAPGMVGAHRPVDVLSRSPSVDFALSKAHPDVAAFLEGCEPVKDWTPPE